MTLRRLVEVRDCDWFVLFRNFVAGLLADVGPNIKGIRLVFSGGRSIPISELYHIEVEMKDG